MFWLLFRCCMVGWSPSDWAPASNAGDVAVEEKFDDPLSLELGLVGTFLGLFWNLLALSELEALLSISSGVSVTSGSEEASVSVLESLDPPATKDLLGPPASVGWGWRPAGLLLLARCVLVLLLSGCSLVVSRVLADRRRPSLWTWSFSPMNDE